MKLFELSSYDEITFLRKIGKQLFSDATKSAIKSMGIKTRKGSEERTWPLDFIFEWKLLKMG